MKRRLSARAPGQPVFPDDFYDLPYRSLSDVKTVHDLAICDARYQEHLSYCDARVENISGLGTEILSAHEARVDRVPRAAEPFADNVFVYAIVEVHQDVTACFGDV